MAAIQKAINDACRRLGTIGTTVCQAVLGTTIIQTLINDLQNKVDTHTTCVHAKMCKM